MNNGLQVLWMSSFKTNTKAKYSYALQKTMARIHYDLKRALTQAYYFEPGRHQSDCGEIAKTHDGE